MRKRALFIVVCLVAVAAVAAFGSRMKPAEAYRPKAEPGQTQAPLPDATPPPALAKTETPQISLDLADGTTLKPGQTVKGTTSVAGNVLQLRLKSAKGGQLMSQSIPVAGQGGVTREFSFQIDYDAALAAGSQGVLEISEESATPGTPSVRVIREVRFE